MSFKSSCSECEGEPLDMNGVCMKCGEIQEISTDEWLNWGAEFEFSKEE